MTQILDNHRVRYEERDVVLSREVRQQLQERLPNSTVPQVFLNGKHLGVSGSPKMVRGSNAYELFAQDLTAIHNMNENGELAKVFANVPVGVWLVGRHHRVEQFLTPFFFYWQKLKVGEAGKCSECDGRGFVVCEWCGGDRKVRENLMSTFSTSSTR